MVTRLSVAGDQQSDLRAHGGPDKAVYAYAVEDQDWWSKELHRELLPGSFGENLSTRGIDLTAAHIGDRWMVGNAVLEVSQPRIPCFKLGIRFGDPMMLRRFAAALRPGAYLRVVQPGELRAGDEIEVRSAPEHDVTVGLVARAYHRDHGLAERLLDAPQLAAGWREWATHVARLGSQATRSGLDTEAVAG